MYRSFVSCIVRSFVCVFRIVRSFQFVRSCIVRFSYRSCEAFARFSFVSFAFFVRLRLVRIASLYDPGSVFATFINFYEEFKTKHLWKFSPVIFVKAVHVLNY